MIYTFNIKISGNPYKKLIRLPNNPNIAIVVFSLIGKHNSQENSNVNAIIAEHPQTKKYIIKKNILFTCIAIIKIANKTVTKALQILNTDLNDLSFFIAVPTHISPIKPAITPTNTKLL